LRGAALRGAALRGVALRGVALRGVALRGVALRGAALRGAAFLGARVRRIGLPRVRGPCGRAKPWVGTGATASTVKRVGPSDMKT
jgi:hypothetical protein